VSRIASDVKMSLRVIAPSRRFLIVAPRRERPCGSVRSARDVDRRAHLEYLLATMREFSRTYVAERDGVYEVALSLRSGRPELLVVVDVPGREWTFPPYMARPRFQCAYSSGHLGTRSAARRGGSATRRSGKLAVPRAARQKRWIIRDQGAGPAGRILGRSRTRRGAHNRRPGNVICGNQQRLGTSAPVPSRWQP
jgi:hypothetical protein